MRWFVTVVLLVHGLIHLLGPAKAFGLAPLPQLHKQIPIAMGMIWLLGAILVLAAAVSLHIWPRGFWAVGLLAAIVSQLVLFSAWPDAKFGTIANVLLLIASTIGFFMYGPTSSHGQFVRDSSPRSTSAAKLVTEADLDPLPEPVKRYLRAVGVVGQPRVQSYSLYFRGRIRGGPQDPWMSFDATQVSFANLPSRLFWMDATKAGLPVSVYHRFVAGEATMRVKLLGAISMVNARGDVMDRSETVTLFNDMCILAPATLIGPGIAWRALDADRAEARFTLGRHTITATLIFGEDGLLRDFISDDRSRLAADGKSAAQMRFSTPVRDYRKYGPFLLASHGEARWHPPEGNFAYGEFDLIDVAYNRVP